MVGSELTEPAPQWEADLAELVAFAIRRPRPHHEPGQPLAAIGLLFWPNLTSAYDDAPADQWSADFTSGYDDTPADARVLCRSGVDGVHWSALPAPASPSGYMVVMTVPGAPNLVVGESVREFLALGCEASFFALNVLAYDEWVALDDSYDEQAGLDPSYYDPAMTTLAELRAELNISPWTDVPRRLVELHHRYGTPPPVVPLNQRDG
jgi:hypothetical protein